MEKGRPTILKKCRSKIEEMARGWGPGGYDLNLSQSSKVDRFPF